MKGGRARRLPDRTAHNTKQTVVVMRYDAAGSTPVQHGAVDASIVIKTSVASVRLNAAGKFRRF